MRKIVAATFRWPGAKATLAPTILKYAPKQGRKFVDLFSGRGNLFFRAVAENLKFQQWVLNDTLTSGFFRALRDIGGQVSVPVASPEEFERQRELAARGNQRALLLEPFLCFNGGTYASGGSTTEGGRRTPKSYEANLRLAHKAMTSASPRITALDWLNCAESEKLRAGDFVLLDVPYMDCSVGPYRPDSVIPAEIVAWLKDAPCDWILCEYRQPFYLSSLGEPVFQKEVQNRATNFATAPQQRRIECLWTNIGRQNPSVTVPNRCSATVRAGAYKEYRALSTDDLLKEIAEAVEKIEENQLNTSAEIRRRLMPALIALRARLKRKKPGYYETLEKMGLNPSRVRSWFYRGHHGEETIQMLERESDSPARAKRRNGSEHELTDEKDDLLQHADRMAAALLRGKVDFARRLASEYANVRRLTIPDPRERSSAL